MKNIIIGLFLFISTATFAAKVALVPAAPELDPLADQVLTAKIGRAHV